MRQSVSDRVPLQPQEKGGDGERTLLMAAQIKGCKPHIADRKLLRGCIGQTSANVSTCRVYVGRRDKVLQRTRVQRRLQDRNAVVLQHV